MLIVSNISAGRDKGDSVVIDLRDILYWPHGSTQIKVDFEHD